MTVARALTRSALAQETAPAINPRGPAEVVESCFTAFAARDLTRFLELVHPNVSWCPASLDFIPASPGRDGYHGHEGIRAWFADVERLTYEVERRNFRSEGHHVVVDAEVSLASPDGFSVHVGVWFVFELEGGTVMSLRTFFDRSAALEAVRLGE
jgi:ketosteroid isomerase-like protein